MISLCRVCFTRVPATPTELRCGRCGGAAPIAEAVKQQRVQQRARAEQHGVDFTNDLAALLAELPASE